MLESKDGVIQKQYRVNDNKLINLKVIESPSFQFSIQQIFCDVKEVERLLDSGLPMIESSSVVSVLTWPEMCALSYFLGEYAKDYGAAANAIMAKKDETI